MKAIRLALFVMLLAGGAAAQGTSSPPPAPDVEVVSISSRKVEYAPMFDEYSTAAANPETAGRMAVNQARRNGAQDFTTTGADPSPPLLDVPRGNSTERRLVRPWPEYLYVFTVKNNGSRTIRHLVWEHRFAAARTQKTVGRRLYKGDVKILPGMTSKLALGSSKPSAVRVKVTQGEERPQGGASGQMVILQIEYEDGTVWKRDSK